jgi:hypothetical protein
MTSSELFMGSADGLVLSFNNLTIFDSSKTGGTGILRFTGVKAMDIDFINCTFDNIANKYGVMQLASTGTVNIDGCTFSNINCTASNGAGGISASDGGSINIRNTVFDNVRYTGRIGESYCDMKDQFPIRTVECKVADMTEPNIRPQESGNRCDCTEASVSNGKVTVTFKAVDKPFELGIKPYSYWSLCMMKHREDEKRTGTYVTIQAFQQGIGTGICGPETAQEYCYPAKGEYELKFLISTSNASK